MENLIKTEIIKDIITTTSDAELGYEVISAENKGLIGSITDCAFLSITNPLNIERINNHMLSKEDLISRNVKNNWIEIRVHFKEDTEILNRIEFYNFIYYKDGGADLEPFEIDINNEEKQNLISCALESIRYMKTI